MTILRHPGETRKCIYGFFRLDTATLCPSIEWLIWRIDNINGEPFVLLTQDTKVLVEPMPADIPYRLIYEASKREKTVNVFTVARLD